MKTSSSSTLAVILLIALYCLSAADYCDEQKDFLECLKDDTSISRVVYTPTNSSYLSILKFSIKNLRFASESTPKPIFIITPEQESHIPPIIVCAKRSGLQIRTRSGGHDAEGRSYVSQVPFLVIDLINLSKITVDEEEKTAWVEAGATIGSLYYKIAEISSTLGFPAGICPSVGVGGHFSGGGYGSLVRKYGLAADNVIDARIADVNGNILDREEMGEDLFWAIRGGIGSSFGVILAWKVQLVDVPEKLVAFAVKRTSQQNATQLIHRWQYVAPKIDRDLFLMVQIRQDDSSKDTKNMTICASFSAMFLGGPDQLLTLMHENFPELGVVREDCKEMSWIQATIFFASLNGYSSGPLEILLNRAQPVVSNFKLKTDYVQKPIPEKGLNGLWRFLYEEEGSAAAIALIPYGGRMDDILESSLPFPHRAGNLYSLTTFVFWGEEAQNSDRYIGWIRRFHRYMTPYVSKSPRATYANDRDLDIGVNNLEGETSYGQASIWGFKYFNKNFDRLVQVKTSVDPENFFRDEQSIPSLIN